MKKPRHRRAGLRLNHPKGACRCDNGKPTETIPQSVAQRSGRLASRGLYTHAHTVLGSAQHTKKPRRSGAKGRKRAFAVTRLASSQQSVARIVAKKALEVLMITEPEVNFRKRRLERLLRVCWATIWVGSTGDCATAVTATAVIPTATTVPMINVLLFRMVASIFWHCSKLWEARL